MLVVGIVARVAFEAREDREVPRVGVTLGAGRPLVAVSAGEDRKELVVMLREVGALPGARVVTDLTVLGETRCLVIRITGVVVVAAVTGPAIGGCARESVAVACLTVEIAMGTGERKELIVIHVRTFPGAGRMATFAVGRETGLDVIGIVGTFVVLSMTAVALRGCPLESVGVAILTIQASVRAGQPEDLVVVELGAFPGSSVMACLALGRKACLDMIRILSVLVVLAVAAVAVGRGTHKAVLMAIGAFEIAMTVGQRKKAWSKSIPPSIRAGCHEIVV